MKQFVLKTPTPVFILIIFLPIIVNLLPFVEITFKSHPKLFDFLRIIQIVTVAMWFSSILDFFCSEKNEVKNKGLIQLLIIISSVISAFSYLVNFWIGYLIVLIIWIVMIVLLTKKVKALFYERSTWFIVTELILVPVGFYTLSETIKSWEGDKDFTGKE